MARDRFVLIFSVMLLCALAPRPAQGLGPALEVFSPVTAQTFHKIAGDIGPADQLSGDHAKQALILLYAATQLDDRPEYVYPDLLTVASQFTDRQYNQLVYFIFDRYVTENSDLEISHKAIRFLLGNQDSRQGRESLLTMLLKRAGAKNTAIASELSMHLALLSAEVANVEGSLQYLLMAYQANPYNKLAFAKLTELVAQTGESIIPSDHARHMRLAKGVNPLDFEAAFAFSAYVEQFELYDIAASGYEYCAELFAFIYPDKKLPESIYLPWALASYNAPRGQGKCIEIARKVRQSGRFDLVLEGIAGRAAQKLGDISRGDELIVAGLTAEEMLGDKAVAPQVTAEELGWFYCFALPDPEKALAWTNRAYSADPESASTKALFACALGLSGQGGIAEEFALPFRTSDQIAALTIGRAKIKDANKQVAFEALKSAIAMDPGSLSAEQARVLLAENGSEYVSTNLGEVVEQALLKNFGERIVPRFQSPDKLFSVKLSLSGSEFFYDSEFGAKLVITNTSDEPLVVSEDGLLRGDIRVDAEIRGDITARVENLLSMRVRPSKPIEPGKHLSIPLKVMTGPLRRYLLGHPQATVEIEFTAYLDPVSDADGTVRNGLKGVLPVRTIVQRRGVVLTQKYLIQRLDALARGQEGQKVRTAQLFTGLLMEQYMMSASAKPLYRYMEVDRLLLVDAIRRGLVDENWRVRVQTMSAIRLLAGPLDFSLTTAISESLNDKNWAVRLMSLYLLSELQGDDFKRVLDWTAKYDTDTLVRGMAIALGGDEPEVPEAAPEVEAAVSRQPTGDYGSIGS